MILIRRDAALRRLHRCVLPDLLLYYVALWTVELLFLS